MPQTPAKFHTSDRTRLSLSAAFFTQFNKRGLEANYTPAWISTLNDACSFSNRLAAAGESYLSVPGSVIRQHEAAATQKELEAKRRELENARLRSQQAPNLANQRSSVRIRESQEFEFERAVKVVKVALLETKNLKYDERKKEKAQMLDLDGDYDLLVDTSIGGESMHDKHAQDNKADMSIAHVVGGYLPHLQSNASKSTKAKYAARAGIKVVHRCLPLIGEIKAAPSRKITSSTNVEDDSNDVEPVEAGTSDSEDDEETATEDPEYEQGLKWHKELGVKLSDAKLDLMYYCAVYFILHPNTNRVIGLISSGPFWRWAIVKKKDVPNYHWPSRTIAPGEKNEEKYDAFLLLFNGEHHTLGTSESDDQIDKMVTIIRDIQVKCEEQEYVTPICYREVPDLND